MIRSFFGLTRNPFSQEHITLLPHQQGVLDTLRVHCQQGGLCLVLGDPGTGKSVLKETLRSFDPKRLVTPTVSRSLHTYSNIIKILSEAFQLELGGGTIRCEQRLIEKAFELNQQSKMLAPIIDDAHLMDIQCLRKLRLLLGRVGDWRGCLSAPFPVPATSNAACGFPALRFPVAFMSKVMGPIGLAALPLPGNTEFGSR